MKTQESRFYPWRSFWPISCWILSSLLLLIGAIPVSKSLQSAPRLQVLQVSDENFPRIRVDFLLTNPQGAPVKGLSTEHFEVLEDGQPVSEFQIQEISTSTLPIAIALAIDRSGSMRSSWSTVVEAISSFVGTLQEEDWVALVTFGDQAEVNLTWTQDKNAVLTQMQSIEVGGKTALYDALIQALRLLQQRGERKVLIVLTDGEDVGSQATLEDVLQLALQSGVAIYPVGFGQVQRQPLERLATVTGGMAQVGENVETVTSAFTLLATDLRHQYTLEFTSALPADGKNHHLEIRAHFQGWSVSATTSFRARPGKVTIELKEPAEGSTVGGTVLLRPKILTPAPNIERLEVYLDDVLLGVVTEPPFEFAWDASEVPPGPHTLRLVAIDSAQNRGEQRVRVTVRPPIKIIWKLPTQEDATLQGEVTLSILLDSVAPVSKVQFFVDDREIQTLPGGTQSEYQVLWDTTQVSPGEHVLKVVVTDTEGHQASVERTVQIALQSRGGVIWLAILVFMATLAIVIPIALRTRRNRVQREKEFQEAKAVSEALPKTPLSGRPVLVEMKGLQPGQVWPIDKEEIHLGRSRKDNDIFLAGTTASRRQALIRRVGNDYVLYNLSPHNPIRVNGQPVTQQHVLQPGDVLEAGESILRFEYRG